MRVTLVRPPFYVLNNTGGAFHPLGIGYLSAALTAAGHDVSLVDGESMKFGGGSSLATALGKARVGLFPYAKSTRKNERFAEIMSSPKHPVWQKVVNEIEQSNPDLVGISCFTVGMTSVKRIVDELRNRGNEVAVVLGGVHPTSMPEQALRDVPSLRCVVLGEGETTFPALCHELSQNNPELGRIGGIAYLDKKGNYVSTGRAPLIEELDSLPLPTRNWQSNSYAYHSGMTSRGCPYTCQFCDSRSIWTRRVRYISISRLMEELETIRSLGHSFLRYADDTFTLDHKRVTHWMEAVRAHGFDRDMKFSFGTRVELITREVVEEYARAGVIEISLGVESGSARIRKKISKDFKNSDPYEAAKIVNDAGIGCRTYFMIGHPEETPDDVARTITLIRRMSSLPRTYVEVNVTCPYPGTDLWTLAHSPEDAEQFVDIETYYRMSHQNRPMVNLTSMSDDELEHQISLAYSVSARSVLKFRAKVLGGQLLRNPFATIKFIRDRLSAG